MCPHCRQNAPVLYRGITAYCTACGAPRPPLSGTAVNLAGQPSKVGGLFAKVLGWIVLGLGSVVGLTLLAFFLWLFPGSLIGWLLGLPVLVIAAVAGGLLLWSGRSLKRTGETTERATHEQAIFALASHRGGVVTAQDVAASLNVAHARAEELLMALAKERPDWVTLEVDDASGHIYYRIVSPEVRARMRDDHLKARIDAAVARPTRVAPDAAEEAAELDEAEVRAQARNRA
jgi:hypothetical protein